MPIDKYNRTIITLQAADAPSQMEAAYRLGSSSSSLHQLKREAQLLTEDVIR